MVAKERSPRFNFGKPSQRLKVAVNLVASLKWARLPDGDELVEWAEDVIRGEEFRRLGVVAKHFNIEGHFDNCETRVAIIFLRKIISNFDPMAKGSGNPRNVMLEHGSIFIDVTREQARKGVLLTQAIETVRKRHCLKRGEVENYYHRVRRFLKKNGVAILSDAAAQMHMEECAGCSASSNKRN